MELETTACFSGYRAEKLPFSVVDENFEYEDFLRKLNQSVRAAVQDGYRTFYTGVCTGFDILAGETVLRLRRGDPRIRLIAVLPFEEQANGWSEFWRERYFSMLEQCDEVITLQPRYRAGCYLRRNRYMVDRSSCLICFYDGKSGGTQSTVLYAQKMGLTVVSL